MISFCINLDAIHLKQLILPMFSLEGHLDNFFEIFFYILLLVKYLTIKLVGYKNTHSQSPQRNQLQNSSVRTPTGAGLRL